MPRLTVDVADTCPTGSAVVNAKATLLIERVDSLIIDGDFDLAVPSANDTDTTNGELPLNGVVVNLDDQADTGDLLILLSNFNQPGDFSQGDFSGDGAVNTGNPITLLANFNTPCPWRSHPAA